MPADAVLELSGVTVRRDGVALLSEVDWRVQPGERWVVVGANGAGKTTLLQVATGTLRPTSGGVRLLGEDLDEADLDELLPRVGWSSAALTEQLPRDERAVDIVLTATTAALRRGSEHYEAYDEERARALLAQLGCRELADRSFATLSEGERKRVQLARALMPDPELLVMDEPAAGLDLGGREALLRRLGRLAGDAAAPTLVLVTHHVEEVPPGFTHGLLLRRGEIVEAGPLGEVFTERALSACFGLPLWVSRRAGRYTAQARV